MICMRCIGRIRYTLVVLLYIVYDYRIFEMNFYSENRNS